MVRLIPLNTVYITYQPSTAPTVTRLYYGVLMGVLRDLHDLPSTDNGGHYTVLEADTMVVDPADTSSVFLLEGNKDLDASALPDVNLLETGAASTKFENLSLTGLTYDNTDGGKLYYEVTGTTPSLVLKIYKTWTGAALANQVAESVTFEETETDIVITSRNNSGISGTVDSTTATSVTAAVNNYFNCLIDRIDAIEPYEYPNYKTESLIDTSTVSIYAKDMKYFAFGQTSVASSPNYRLLPIQCSTYDAFSLITVNSTEENASLSVSTNTVSMDFGAPILPGSLAISFGPAASGVATWIASTSYAEGDIVTNGAGTDYFVCITAGTSNDTEGEEFVTTSVGVTTTETDLVEWRYLGTDTQQVYVDAPVDGTDEITGTLRLLNESGDTTATAGTIDRYGLGALSNVTIDYLTGTVSFDAADASVVTGDALTGSDAYCISYEYVTDTTVINNVMKYIKSGDYVLISNRNHTGDTGADGSDAVTLTYAANTTYEFGINEMKTTLIDEDYNTNTFVTKNGNKRAVIKSNLDSFSITTLDGSTVTLSNVLTVNPNTFSFMDGTTRKIDLRPVPYFSFALSEADVYSELEESAGIIDITTTGTALTKGKIDFDNESITLLTVARDSFTGSIVPDISSGIFASDGNFVSGGLYIEYEAEIRSSQYLNQLVEYDADLFDTTNGAPLGPIDPRNKLGYAAYLTNMISPTSTFYVMPITSESSGLADGLDILTNYRDILHVAVVTDEYENTLDTWIDPNVTGSENSPEVARFRIGYMPAELKTRIDRVLDSQSIAGTRYTIDGGYTRFEATDTNIDFESTYAVAVGDTCVITYDDATTEELTISDVSGFILTFSSIGSSATSKAVSSIAVYKPLTSSSQIASYMASIQNSENSYMVKTLCESVPFTYNRVDTGVENTITLGREFSVIFPFTLKISTPAHQPTTFITFENYGFGLVSNSSTLFSRSDFETLVAAGYYVMTNDLGTAPYCLRDVTCGVIGPNGELGGALSKVTPVVIYAKEIWDITRDFLGKYNVVSDVINMLALKLNALADKYTTRKYQYLGTLLYEASSPTITEISNGVNVEYTVRPQDAFIEINNFITVLEKLG